MKSELFLSLDIEADGPSPLVSSMLSFAFAAFTVDKVLVSTFSRNLETREGSHPSLDTLSWWNSSDTNKQAYEETRKNVIPIAQAMDDARAWAKELSATYKLIPLAWPAGYDAMWFNAYATAYSNESDFPQNPLGIAWIDGKSFVLGRFPNNIYRNMSKRTYPKQWFENLPHTHVALDDALEQGCLFVNALREARNLPQIVGYTKE